VSRTYLDAFSHHWNQRRVKGVALNLEDVQILESEFPSETQARSILSVIGAGSRT
jgi:hypothetical protein